MTTIVGILIAAVLFGLFAVLRPSDRAGRVGCTGDCGACTRDGACETKVSERAMASSRAAQTKGVQP